MQIVSWPSWREINSAYAPSSAALHNAAPGGRRDNLNMVKARIDQQGVRVESDGIFQN
jgi:hypothetical protein